MDQPHIKCSAASLRLQATVLDRVAESLDLHLSTHESNLGTLESPLIPSVFSPLLSNSDKDLHFLESVRI